MKVAIIPARIGSKRIPKKNIKNFCGKPIIYWAIKAAKKSKIFDKIIVSTDDKKTALLAKRYKAEVPFLRPHKLADDKTNTMEVIVHAIQWLKKNNLDPQFICCIYATAALIKPKDIIKGFNKIKERKWNYVFSATNFSSPISRAFKKDSLGRVKMYNSKNYYSRSQDLIKSYHDAGQFYWARTNTWLKSKPIFGKSSTIINIPNSRVHDINTDEDWKFAEKIARVSNLH